MLSAWRAEKGSQRPLSPLLATSHDEERRVRRRSWKIPFGPHGDGNIYDLATVTEIADRRENLVRDDDRYVDRPPQSRGGARCALSCVYVVRAVDVERGAGALQRRGDATAGRHVRSRFTLVYFLYHGTCRGETASHLSGIGSVCVVHAGHTRTSWPPT